MNEANNPAARLNTILKEGRGQSRTEGSISVWHRLLMVPKDNMSIFYHRLGLVVNLSHIIETQIKCIKNINQQLYLKEIPVVHRAFEKLNLQASFSGFIDQITDTVIYGVDFCSDLLSKQFPEKTIRFTLQIDFVF